MPVVGIPVNMLLARIATKLSRDELVTHLQHLGCDVEGYTTVRRFRCIKCDNIAEITPTENPPILCDRCGIDFKENESLQEPLGKSDVIRMELLAVRPDMFDPGGLARVLRHYFKEEKEPSKYELSPANFSVHVDPALENDSSFRPNIGCAVVRGLNLDDDKVKVIMKLQENLHWALGRDRKHASIGVYDLNTLCGPKFSYRTVAPNELKFVPLGYKSDASLTPDQILKEHPKGKAYARLLEKFDRYPLLCDAKGKVLSMPPIINSEDTRVTRTTCNFFIDVTGTEERIVNKTLNIMVTSLAELDPKASIEQVRIVYPTHETVTPNLEPQKVLLKTALPARTIGISLPPKKVIDHLHQMGHRVVENTSNQETLTVLVPAYRNDILHPIDLVEDIAIAYGYHNIEPCLVPTMTVGDEQPNQKLATISKKILNGLGFFEIMTLILSSEKLQYEMLGLPVQSDSVLIDNPISVDQTLVRTSLIPGILDIFAVNSDHELPQKIFEVGNISQIDSKAETGAKEILTISAGAIGPLIDYAQIRSTAQALLREFSCSLKTQPSDLACFIPGRGAKIIACQKNESKTVGYMGEIHPQVLENFKLVHPVAILELNLEALR